MNEFKTIIDGIRSFSDIVKDFVYYLDGPDYEEK